LGEETKFQSGDTIKDDDGGDSIAGALIHRYVHLNNEEEGDGQPSNVKWPAKLSDIELGAAKHI
jgi:hypothetical protein